MISMVVLWDFYRFSMENLCKLYGVSMIFDGVSKGVSMLVVLGSYGGPKGCLWDFLWIPMGFLWYFYDISMEFLWDVHDISMGLLWDFERDVDDISMGFLWGFKRIPLGFPLDSYRNPLIFLWDPFAISMIEGSLEVKLPTLWTDEKQRWEESERREE